MVKTIIWWFSGVSTCIAVIYLFIISSSKLPAKRENHHWRCPAWYIRLVFSFHRQSFLDEDLMRVYIIVFQYSYTSIHHFINIIRVFAKTLSWRCNISLSSWRESNGIHGCSSLDRWYKWGCCVQVSTSSTPAIPFLLGASPLLSAIEPTKEEYRHSRTRKSPYRHSPWCQV